MIIPAFLTYLVTNAIGKYVFGFQKVQETEKENSKCSICLEVIAHSAVETRCEHSFHNSCITNWIQLATNEDETCPICRTKWCMELALARADSSEVEKKLYLDRRMQEIEPLLFSQSVSDWEIKWETLAKALEDPFIKEPSALKEQIQMHLQVLKKLIIYLDHVHNIGNLFITQALYALFLRTVETYFSRISSSVATKEAFLSLIDEYKASFVPIFKEVGHKFLAHFENSAELITLFDSDVALQGISYILP